MISPQGISPCPSPFRHNGKEHDTDTDSHAVEGKTLRHRIHQRHQRRQDVYNRQRWIRKLRSGQYDTTRRRRQHHVKRQNRIQQDDGRRGQTEKSSRKHRKYRYVSK